MEGGDGGNDLVVDSKDLQQQSKAFNKLTYRVEDRQLNSSRAQSAMASIAASAEAEKNAMRLRFHFFISLLPKPTMSSKETTHGALNMPHLSKPLQGSNYYMNLPSYMLPDVVQIRDSNRAMLLAAATQQHCSVLDFGYLITCVNDIKLVFTWISSAKETATGEGAPYGVDINTGG
ncbi:hypothetical protein REPUB_Repub17cG0055800 [Reevesia pubescens]